jgi:hypothetical protein
VLGKGAGAFIAKQAVRVLDAVRLLNPMAAVLAKAYCECIAEEAAFLVAVNCQDKGAEFIEFEQKFAVAIKVGITRFALLVLTGRGAVWHANNIAKLSSNASEPIIFAFHNDQLPIREASPLRASRFHKTGGLQLFAKGISPFVLRILVS